MLDTFTEIFAWHDDTSINFLVDGEQFYPSMLKAIEQADKYILMEMYLFESSKIADKFIKVLIAASKRNLSVQLLIDAFGGLGLLKTDRKKLTDAGIQLVFYNPLIFKNLRQNLFRTHRKYLIIDGNILFVGGAGITDSFKGETAWRETVIEVQGNIIADWQTLFINTFKQYSASPVSKPAVFKEKKNGIQARLAYTCGGTRLEIKKVLLNRITSCEDSIWLASAYFVPSRKLRKALRKAAIKGKDVRLLLPGPITDHPAVRYASRRYYARLLRFGVRVFEYQERFTHTKMVLIDDWFTIGSSNMDRWNFRWNLEANIEIDDETATNVARKILLNDFNNCREIHYHHWVARSRIQRFKEWIWGKIDIWLAKY